MKELYSKSCLLALSPVFIMGIIIAYCTSWWILIAFPISFLLIWWVGFCIDNFD